VQGWGRSERYSILAALLFENMAELTFFFSLFSPFTASRVIAFPHVPTRLTTTRKAK